MNCAAHTINKDNYILLNQYIRSFKKNGEKFIDFLTLLNTTPSIIVLTETWNKSENINLCSIESYNGFHTYRNHIRSGGVSVFLRNSFKGEKVEEMSICDETIEICTVKVELTDGYQLVMGLYRPHSGTTTDFTDKLESLLENPLVQNSKW